MTSAILSVNLHWPTKSVSSTQPAKYQKDGIFGGLPMQHRNLKCRICKVEAMRGAPRKVTMPLLNTEDRLYKRLSRLGDPKLDAIKVLQQWLNEGRRIKRWQLQGFVKQLRKYRRYKHALEVSEWIASGKNYRLSAADCAIRLDLIAKVHGIQSVEKYFEQLPDAAKNKLTYGALLNAYVKEKMVEKAEEIMEIIKSSGYLTNALNYNAMMNLYMNTYQFEKVPLVFQEMRENGIPPDSFSYNIWITTCAAMSDVDKMEKVMDDVKRDNNVNTDWTIYSTLANMYIKAGLVNKAESALDEVKSKMPQKERSAYEFLISQYASLCNIDEMYRIWKNLKAAFPKVLNRTYIFMLSSLLKTGDIEGAEEIFKEWESVCSTYDIRIPNMFLGFYVRKGCLEKAELLFEHILERGGKPNFNTWEIMAERYIQKGNFQQAVKAMNNSAKIAKFSKWQPKPANVLAILTHFEKQGDIESAEDFFKMLMDSKCINAEMYNSLLQTYIKADRTNPWILKHTTKLEVSPNEETEMLIRQISKF